MRMNDSKRWLKVADAIASKHWLRSGICNTIRDVFGYGIKVRRRIVGQLTLAIMNGKLGEKAQRRFRRDVYYWPPRQRAPRVAACKKMARIVKGR